MFSAFIIKLHICKELTELILFKARGHHVHLVYVAHVNL